MRLNLTVKPNSGKRDLEKISDYEFKANLKSSPEDNKANVELIKLLRKEFKAKDVKIVSGKTSRKKVIELCQ